MSWPGGYASNVLPYSYQTGWVCPKCERVYNPIVQMCLFCPPLTYTTSGTNAYPTVDSPTVPGR